MAPQQCPNAIMDHDCFGVSEWSKLSPKAKEFIRCAEDDIGRPVTLISTGPELSQIIDLRAENGD